MPWDKNYYYRSFYEKRKLKILPFNQGSMNQNRPENFEIFRTKPDQDQDQFGNLRPKKLKNQ